MIKKFLPRSLLGRSLLILVTPVILIQVVATYMFFHRHWDTMTQRLAYAVAGEIAVFAHHVERGDSQESLNALARDMQDALDLTIRYQDGAKVESVKRYHESWGSVVADTLSRAIEKQVRRPYDINIDIDDKWVEISIQLKDGVMVVSSPQNRLFSASARIYILWVIGSSAVLLLIAMQFMRGQIRPIKRLAVAAERLGKGRDVPFFKPEGAREVRQAAQAFLDMRARIDRQMAQRTAMLAGVSHDLRTPLTRMKLQAEMMGDSADAQDMKSDIADMERMIAAYLDFVRGLGDETPQRTDIQTILDRIAGAARREGAKVDVSAEGDLSVMLRPVAFERCLSNLVGNGIKYATNVKVSAGRGEDFIWVDIDDDGPGIPAEMQEDVFKPFFRLESSRNKKTGGVGLGLPIAQDIIHAHGGTIELSKSPMGGVKAQVTVPV